MLADTAPSAWLASQTIHWAASLVESSSANAAVQAKSRIVASRKARSSSMTSRSPSMWAAPPIVVMSSVGLVATWGIGLLKLRTQPILAARRHHPSRRVPANGRDGPRSKRRLGHHQDDDRDDQDPEEHPTLLGSLHGGH